MDPWRVIGYTSYTIYSTLVLVVFFVVIYLFGIYLFSLIKKNLLVLQKTSSPKRKKSASVKTEEGDMKRP